MPESMIDMIILKIMLEHFVEESLPSYLYLAKIFEKLLQHGLHSKNNENIFGIQSKCLLIKIILADI